MYIPVTYLYLPGGAIKCEPLPLSEEQVMLIGLIDGVVYTCSSDTKLAPPDRLSTSTRMPLIVP